MKEIVFLTNQMGLQGSYLNHLDLQQHLKDHEGYKVKFYCENVKKLFEVVRDSRRGYTFTKGEPKILKNEIVELGSVIITDFKTFLMAEKMNWWIICDTVLVMDSIELTYHLKDMKHARFYHSIDIEKAAKHFYANKILFLMPPNNHELFKVKHPTLESRPFFKIINTDMLKTLECENRPGYFYRWDDSKDYREEVTGKFGNDGVNYEPDWKLKLGHRIPLKYNEINHIFDYETLVYRRRKYLEFQEQFGRLIFEYILLGKTVYFACEPFSDDGLTDYLHYYDIKFDGNKIITTKEELEEKMKGYDDRPWEI